MGRRIRDDRLYITVATGLPAHPKIEALSDGAFRLLVEMWCWCGQNLTDGRIEDTSWRRRRTPKIRAELVAAGLVEQTADGNWQMHDYLEHQMSKTEILDLREKRREAGSRGGKSRSQTQANAQTSAKQVLEQTASKTQASAQANGQANVKQNTSKTQPEVEVEVEVNKDQEQRGKPTRRSEIDEAERPDIDRICDHLVARIVDNGAKAPAITKGWRDAARLMLDRDGRTEEQIHAAIDWCQADDFWRANILSLPKLREQYERLRLAAMRPAGSRDKQADILRNEMAWANEVQAMLPAPLAAIEAAS